MNVTQKRFMLFLGLCIPTRFTISYLAKEEKFKKYLDYLAIICLCMGIGFLNIYFFGSKKADSQLKWAGEDTVWWNDLRLLHGISYVLFSILVYLKKEYAWKVIFYDTLVGLCSFLYYHYSNESFNKLI